VRVDRGWVGVGVSAGRVDRRGAGARVNGEQSRCLDGSVPLSGYDGMGKSSSRLDDWDPGLWTTACPWVREGPSGVRTSRSGASSMARPCLSSNPDADVPGAYESTSSAASGGPARLKWT